MSANVLRTLSVPEWAHGPVVKGMALAGLAINGLLAGCSSEQAPYSGGNISFVIEAEAPAFGDAKQDFIPLACGRTAARAQVVPVGQVEADDHNPVGEGSVLRYEVKVGAGGVTLKDGHSCGDRVWIFAGLASPAGPLPAAKAS